MIRHIALSNFKAFGPEQQIPLRPITLIFGKNSGGKSSVIHSLLLAHHAQQKDTWHVGSPVLAGDSIDLGGFHNYIHRHEAERSMHLAITCDVPPYCKKHPILVAADKVKLALEVAALGNEWRDGDVERRLPSLRSCEVTLDDSPLLTLSRDDENKMYASLHTDHPAVAALINRFAAQLAKTQINQGIHEALCQEARAICADADLGEPFFFPGRVSFAHDLYDEVLDFNNTQPAELEPGEKVRSFARTHFTPVLAGLFATLHLCFTDNLCQLEYLGPLRMLPDRFIPETDGTEPNWKSGGAFAWQRIKDSDSLLQDLNGVLETMKIQYELKVRRIADEDSIQNAVIEYLRDRAEPRLLQAIAEREEKRGERLAEELKLSDADYRDYLLSNPKLHEELAECWQEHHSNLIAEDYSMDNARRDVLGQRMDRELPMDWNELRLEHPEGNPKIQAVQEQLAEPEAQAEGIRSEIIARLTDPRTDLKLVDKRNGTPVTARDVGIGISQMMPVLVHSLGFRNRLIAIEQPEIHLHPALQAELGDVFIESALGGSKNQFLIETHSEHLILRILRRIRETSRGKLPPGKHSIQTSEVAVLYVSPSSEGSTVQELRIDDQGNFLDNWPQGFFEDRLDEMF